MGLPARQHRVLERIETTLRGSDPKLAALYAIFARLTRDEEIPRVEQVRHRALRAFGWLRRRPVAPTAGHHHVRLWPRQPASLFLPLAIAVVAAAVVFGAMSGSGGCIPVRTAASADIMARSAICKPPATMTTELSHGH